MPEIVRESAPAKINPYLRVLGRRSDGFHEIETLILPISLEDRIAVEPRERGFALRVTGPLADRVPAGEDNLAVQAAEALSLELGVARGADILVEKHIPVAAGLGGGSSDAAAVLRALNRLWNAGLTVERLAEIGAEVGSDVPALVHARPVIARGRGELVEPVEIPRTFWVLIALSSEVLARDAYSWVSPSEEPGPGQESLDRLIRAFQEEDLVEAGTLLRNDLAAGVIERFGPEVLSAQKTLLKGGPPGKVLMLIPETDGPVAVLGTVMSGSGPSVAGLCATQVIARRYAAFIPALFVETGDGSAI